jgi:UDP-N-acetylglucosamine 2-epimerase (non-hydrolysing)
VTLHRPSNVDDPDRLRSIVAVLRDMARTRPVVFPAHPRTSARLRDANVDIGNVRLMDPIGYHEMLDLISGAHVVVTDSGGLQEETTALGIPCLTVRANTERPITIVEGTNRLVPEPAQLATALAQVRKPTASRRPEGWDGHAGQRVIDALESRQ